MSKTLALLAVAALVALAVSGTAGAAPAAPYDGGPIGSAQQALHILPTSLLPLGVDLSQFGVASSELATVGPVSSTSSPSSGSMLIVDDDHADCPNAQYTSIQAAVDAAPPGAMIKVCRGTYIEQVSIPAGKDNLTLFSEGDLQAVIKAPLVMTSPKAIVRISG